MTKEVGVSQDNLVDEVPAKKLPQYIAALSVCMGSVAAGTVLGYTGNITKGQLGQGDLNGIYVSEAEYGWIGSAMTLGALIMCFPIGFICDLIGRKIAMLCTIVPFTIGWLLIIFSQNVGMIYGGRFLTGMAGGAFCISAPMYTSEIAQKEIRGALGSYFQLLLTVGILFAYIIGAVANPQITAVVCAIVPLVFGVVFFFQPETPIYLLKKGNQAAAEQSLQRLRGAGYNVRREIEEMQATIDEESKVNISFMESFKKRATKKSLLICFGLMFFQQLSGINAVIFYVGSIFEEAKSSLSTPTATIIVGVMQVAATFVSSLIIDKLGRKILLLVSDCLMAVSGILLGIYFSMSKRDLISKEEVANIGILPILSLCIFIIVFSLGYGPIPWLISSEVFPPEIRSNASSGAGTFNWILAFFVTKFYGDITGENGINTDVTFYIFAGISVLGTIFVFFVVPETKGKTLDQIQRELEGEKGSKSGIDNVAYNS